MKIGKGKNRYEKESDYQQHYYSAVHCGGGISSFEYTEVKATVVSSDNIVRKVLGKRQTQYEVVVEYEGQEYKLKNTHSSAAYIPGKEVTALLHDGKLYANIEGITSTTPVAMVYFVFLFGSFAMVCVSVTLISKARTEG